MFALFRLFMNKQDIYITDRVDEIFISVAQKWIYCFQSNHRVHGVQMPLTFLVHLKVIQKIVLCTSTYSKSFICYCHDNSLYNHN